MQEDGRDLAKRSRSETMECTADLFGDSLSAACED